MAIQLIDLRSRLEECPKLPTDATLWGQALSQQRQGRLFGLGWVAWTGHVVVVHGLLENMVS